MSKRKKKLNEVERDSTDYLESLNEQLEFLINGCNMFDQGNFKYSKQLATHIRILVHDTSQSISLLKLIRKKDSMKFCSTASFPKNALFHLALVSPEIRNVINSHGVQKIEPLFVPNLNDNSFTHKKWVDFDIWYDHKILVNNSDHYSRKDIVIYLANKDGGAHIDPYIESKHYKFSKETESMLNLVPSNSSGDFNVSGEPLKNLYLSTVRQIAHELILSIRKEFGIRCNYNPSLKTILNREPEDIREILIANGDKFEFER